MPAHNDGALVYVGIKGSVVALRAATGEIVWSVPLPRGRDFVPIVVEDGRLFAASGGEISCLDAMTGEPLWYNKLTGFGTGYAMLAGAANAGVAAAAAAEAAARASHPSHSGH